MTRVLFGIALVALAGTSVSAQVILSNLPATNSTTGTNLGIGTDGADRTKGVGLTTGAVPLMFDTITAPVSNAGSDALLSGGIFSDVAGNPGILLAAFDPLNIPSGTVGMNASLSIGGGFTLLPSTTYWFVLDGPSVSNSLLWHSLSPNVAPTANGVAFVGYRFSSNGGSTWGNSTTFNGVSIAVIPAPAAFAPLAGAGLLAFRRRRRA